MAHVLELRDGEIVIPFNLYDMLDIVDDKMGTDARLYLEEYFNDEIEEMESGVDERYAQVFELILDKLREVNTTGSKQKRKEALDAVRMIVERELKRIEGY